MKKLLLHVCCGPCATHSVEALSEYEITLFYSNSNILSKDEFDKRLESVRKVAEINGLNLLVGEYDHEAWLEFVKGLEGEPEGGERCKKCFEWQLKTTAKFADSFDRFATTLTISPHKSSSVINSIGERYEKYLPTDLKKEGGFQRSVELSKSLGLYRQNFCGCEFSQR